MTSERALEDLYERHARQGARLPRPPGADALAAPAAASAETATPVDVVRGTGPADTLDAGDDTVYADLKDDAAADCEHVLRKPAADDE